MQMGQDSRSCSWRTGGPTCPQRVEMQVAFIGGEVGQLVWDRESASGGELINEYEQAA